MELTNEQIIADSEAKLLKRKALREARFEAKQNGTYSGEDALKEIVEQKLSDTDTQ